MEINFSLEGNMGNLGTMEPLRGVMQMRARVTELVLRQRDREREWGGGE